MLKVDNINTYYGTIHALKDVSLEVKSGEIVSLIGSNGAGKSTLVNTISGLLYAKSGTVHFDGEDITNLETHKIVSKGISLAPEGREVFPALTVNENLVLGGYKIKSKIKISESIDMVYDLFPRLKERKNQYAGTLSGGEQQMLAIGRALISQPKLLLLDEPSLGLAPNIVAQIFKLIKEIASKNITILLIEQNAFMALKISDRAYVLENGRVSIEGNSKDIISDANVKKVYLGM